MSFFTRAQLLCSGVFAILAAAQAQAQYVWGANDLIKMRDYTIDRIQVPFGSGNIAFNHRVAVVDPAAATSPSPSIAEYQVLDEILRRCIATGASNCVETNWRPTGRMWDVFIVGTPETVAVTRFYIPSINSHVFVAASEMTGNASTLEVLRQFPNVYVDEGAMFAIKAPLAGFIEGKLPLAQACGEETQSGLTAMLRVYNNGFVKPNLPISVPLSVRFNDGNHLFTTRNDAAFMAELKQIPGWEVAVRDSESSNRRAGVWCVPSQTKALIQSTYFSGLPGQGLVGSWVQALTHELSPFSFDGFTLNVPSDYQGRSHLVSPSIHRTISGQIGVNSNRQNSFALTRGLGGYVEYSYAPGESTVRKVFPKEPLSVDEGWTAIRINEETSVVYAMSQTINAIKIHAYDPASNSYLWQHSLPEEYRSYRIDDSELHLAGNYLVSYLQHFPTTRDAFKGALVVVPLNPAAGSEVRIINLPGPNNLPVDFAYNSRTAVGTFADARAQTFIHLNFNDWSTTVENLPFQPYAVLMSDVSNQLYVTEVPQDSEMHFTPNQGALWKRSLLGGSWTRIANVGFSAVELSVINLRGVPKIVVFNRDGSSGTVPNFQSVDFIDLNTGVKSPALRSDVFGSWDFKKDLAALAERK